MPVVSQVFRYVNSVRTHSDGVAGCHCEDLIHQNDADVARIVVGRVINNLYFGSVLK